MKATSTHFGPSFSTQQSVLKPLVRVPISQGKSVLIRKDTSENTKYNTNAPKYIQGVKLVRNSSGKLVLVQDKTPLKKSPLSPGVKVTIKNNKIQSISKSHSDNKRNSIDASSNAFSDDERNANSEEPLITMEPLESPNSTKISSINESYDESAVIIDLCSESSSATKT